MCTFANNPSTFMKSSTDLYCSSKAALGISQDSVGFFHFVLL